MKRKRTFWWAWWCEVRGWEPTLYTTKARCRVADGEKWECDGYGSHVGCGPFKVKLIILDGWAQR